MRKYLFNCLVLISLLFCLSGCSNISNRQFEIKNEQQLGEVMMNYFINKDKNKLPAIVDFVSKNNYYSGSSKSPLYGFFAGVQHETPNEFIKLEKMQISQSTRKMLRSAKEFDYIVQDMLKMNNYYLESPAALDSFWGYFFATGDERIIKKLCVTAENSDNYIVKSSAKWSLESNRKSYPNKIKSCSFYK